MLGNVAVEPWVTTLMQIGIPSLVTMASLFFTFRLGKASHQKDIAIANLAANSESVKINSERKANLIMEITSAIAEVENAHGTHSGLFRRTVIEDMSAPFSHSKDLQDAFSILSSAIDKFLRARTATYLLGDTRVNALFELYLQSLFGFQQRANPLKGASPIDLNESFDQLSVRRIELLNQLSDLYLDKVPSK